MPVCTLAGCRSRPACGAPASGDTGLSHQPLPCCDGGHDGRCQFCSGENEALPSRLSHQQYHTHSSHHLVDGLFLALLACDWIFFIDVCSYVTHLVDCSHMPDHRSYTAHHMSLISSTAHTCPTTAPIQPIDCCVLTPADPSDGPHPPTGGTPFECGLALLRAMRDYRSLTGFLVGIKVPECRTAHDALLWLSLVVRVAGAEWTTPALIRLSGEDLLHELQRVLSSRDEDYAPDRRH